MTSNRETGMITEKIASLNRGTALNLKKDPCQYREGDQRDYREKDGQNYWKDERYDSGVKDCYEDKGCESDQYDQKSRERYRDVRSNSLEQRQESDHNSGRHCKEWEKDVYQKQTLKERQSNENPVKLSYDHKDHSWSPRFREKWIWKFKAG